MARDESMAWVQLATRIPKSPHRCAETATVDAAECRAPRRSSRGRVTCRPLGGIDVEGRVVPALRLEDRPEKKLAPRELHAGGPSRFFDAQRGRVRVRAGELEPELECLMQELGGRFPRGERQKLV